MDDPRNLQGRLLMARSARSNARAVRDRSLLNIELAERAAITAEGKLADADHEVNKLLDELLLERARQKRLAAAQ